MNQGKIIEYIDQGRFICTLCLQDKGNRLHLLTTFNREVNLSPKRVLLISSASIDTESPREELLSKLKEAEDLRNRLMGNVRVKELWELIREENERFDYKYLAQLCFGDMVTDDHISALVRALFEERLYFKMKDGHFFPNSEERVDQIVRQREEDALKEVILREGSAWLKKVSQDELDQGPSCRVDVIKLLTELALYGNEAPNFKYGKELLLRAGISDIQQTRNLLVSLGVWEEDENLDLHRLDIRTSFNEKQLSESDQLARIEFGENNREDLRNLATFTVDGPLTKDFDDALSLEMIGDSMHIGIHIADVAEVVTPDSSLDKEAFQRGSSLYLPRRQIPMIPPNLSQNTLSLKQGCDRPAISLIGQFDKSGNLVHHRFVPSLIRVQRQLTYDQVNELYLQETFLKQMHRLSQSMHQKRIDQGALILSLPELIFKIQPDSHISLEMVDQETPSRMMVAELMILYNWLVARFCKENNIPILYRGQGESSGRLSVDEAGYVYFVFKQRRKLNPLIIDTEPTPHTGLGLDVYTNVSSPIRRYLDLVVQRQIRNFLLNKSSVYNNEELEGIRMSVEPVLKNLERVKRSRIRYWIQKYLLQHMGEKFSALILDTMKSKYRILLTDFLLVAEMRRENGQNFSAGQRITVTVKKSDPWNDLLNLVYVGQ
jgi:exoribonuclease-2